MNRPPRGGEEGPPLLPKVSLRRMRTPHDAAHYISRAPRRPGRASSPSPTARRTASTTSPGRRSGSGGERATPASPSTGSTRA